jgi:hypothetical protein
MKDFYNSYFSNDCISEISIVNNGKTIISRELFYVEFSDFAKNTLNCKNGFFVDNNNYLENIYNKTIRSSNKEKIFLDNSDNNIVNIQYTKNYYCYIKVLNDYINPQLNGKLLIFKFGFSILQKFLEYYNNITNITNINVTDLYFKHSFIISKLPTPQNSLPTPQNSQYKIIKCDFTNNEINLYDEKLNLDNVISFPKININSLMRRYKLSHLKEISIGNIIIELINDGWDINLINKDEKKTWIAKKDNINLTCNVEFDKPVDCIQNMYETIIKNE